jgi:carbonic anhydrase/acetyltransferase-like protein (isoleucine patch superfamily)
MDLDQRLEQFLGRPPRTVSAAFIASTAVILGDVELGAASSVWYGAVLRADINSIRIGTGSNLQDGVIVHLADDAGVQVGDFTTVGHRAILHACTVGHECLIGMGAIVMDYAVVGDRSIIGANTLVPHGMRIPPGSLVYGSPARVIRPLSPEDQSAIRQWAEKYIQVARAHQARSKGTSGV